MNIDGTYAVSALVGSTWRRGTARIVTVDGQAHMSLDAPVVGKVSARGTAAADGSFSVSGKLRVLFKTVAYSVSGQVDADGTLKAVCTTDAGSAQVIGVRLP